MLCWPTAIEHLMLTFHSRSILQEQVQGSIAKLNRTVNLIHAALCALS